MRLIDADKLIEFIDKGKYCDPNALTFSENDVCAMIEYQPTAYDVDKVVEALALARERWNQEWRSSLDTYDMGRSRGYDDAIYIVKRGVANGQDKRSCD